ncbi:hypothetical protein JCM11641_007118 [Rhodosporidiobolus odoratus]
MHFTTSLLLFSASLALAAPSRLNSTSTDLDLAAQHDYEYSASAQYFELSDHEKRDLEARATSDGVMTTCKNSGQIALTFDDGDYPYGTQIANYLTKQGLKGSFFVNGYNWNCIYDRADDLVARYKQGHIIGSHTWSHPDITKLSDAKFNQQLDLVETALKKILGIKPRFFRAPYGNTNAAKLKILKARGYTVVGWNFDSNDANGRAPADTVNDYKKLVYPKTYIALNHETKEGTAKTVIPQIVPALLKKGYQLVDLPTCLGVSPYQSVGTPGNRDSTWTCSGTPAPSAD